MALTPQEALQRTIEHRENDHGQDEMAASTCRSRP